MFQAGTCPAEGAESVDKETQADVSAVPRQGQHLKALFLFRYLHRDTFNYV